ncbi:DUF1353 domain-containing protein [Mesorhizobium sp. B3-1-3]|uniref:DUF1353 domain-containing protein n=1 Tax=unclassified Mesorhizobium TaxID=325217 RepID=UPI001129105B|nr:MULTISPECIES: DUF1353 domain-containing protein [unclassified Mesorhizobium]TPI54208.1 DUF1353 domain-containing protein [Mesorhizobium sp. B3-1-8]TPI61430.1 DUF1353 domain-containing protein [Mesorhizobium sp. B3-1-3]
MSGHELGRYTGQLILQPLADGRRMRVVKKFGFEEADGLHWRVPPRTIVDGASIPKPLWSLLGGPFEGKYRDASVVHDYYCDARSADWRSVHLMFYRAMLVSGVSVRRAKVMYAAVYFAGPRWSETVVENVTLGRPAVPTALGEDLLFCLRHDPLVLAVSDTIERDRKSAREWGGSGSSGNTNSDIILNVDRLVEVIDRDNPPLRDLEAAIDGAVYFITDDKEAPRNVSVGALAPSAEP